MKINLENDAVTVEMNGEVIHLGPEEFVKAVISMEQKKSVSLQGALLPVGTRFAAIGENAAIIGIERPPTVRDIITNNRGIKKHKEVHFPGMLFVFLSIRLPLWEPYGFVLDKPLMTYDDILYSFSIGNIDYDGRICYGGVSIEYPIEKLGAAVDFFFTTPFNHHLTDKDQDNEFKKLTKDSVYKWSAYMSLRKFLLSKNIKLTETK